MAEPVLNQGTKVLEESIKKVSEVLSVFNQNLEKASAALDKAKKLHAEGSISDKDLERSAETLVDARDEQFTRMAGDVDQFLLVSAGVTVDSAVYMEPSDLSKSEHLDAIVSTIDKLSSIGYATKEELLNDLYEKQDIALDHLEENPSPQNLSSNINILKERGLASDNFVIGYHTGLQAFYDAVLTEEGGEVKLREDRDPEKIDRAVNQIGQDYLMVLRDFIDATRNDRIAEGEEKDKTSVRLAEASQTLAEFRGFLNEYAPLGINQSGLEEAVVKAAVDHQVENYDKLTAIEYLREANFSEDVLAKAKPEIQYGEQKVVDPDFPHFEYDHRYADFQREMEQQMKDIEQLEKLRSSDVDLEEREDILENRFRDFIGNMRDAGVDHLYGPVAEEVYAKIVDSTDSFYVTKDAFNDYLEAHPDLKSRLDEEISRLEAAEAKYDVKTLHGFLIESGKRGSVLTVEEYEELPLKTDTEVAPDTADLVKAMRREVLTDRVQALTGSKIGETKEQVQAEADRGERVDPKEWEETVVADKAQVTISEEEKAVTANETKTDKRELTTPTSPAMKSDKELLQEARKRAASIRERTNKVEDFSEKTSSRSTSPTSAVEREMQRREGQTVGDGKTPPSQGF